MSREADVPLPQRNLRETTHPIAISADHNWAAEQNPKGH